MIGLVRIRRVSRVETLFAVWSLVVVLGVGCGEQPEPTRVTRSLIDTPAAADVLVGAARLDPPSSLAGNRLLTGWTRTRVSGRTAWLPDPVGATIEFVNIGDHPRRLEITTENPGLESEITISLSGRDLGTWSLEPKTVIPLPDDLPLGRVPLRLVFGSPVVVKHLSVRPARSKGSVDFIGDTISQRPSSVVEIVGLIGSDARLKGRFEPPVEAAGNQRFEIVVDAGSAHGPEVVHRWRKRGSSSTVSNIDVPLPSGLVAIRLVARGRGAPASWEGLRIVEDASSPGSGAAHPPKPPRLVVLYVLDALRADHVGGHGWSPVLDRMAAEGVVFSDYSTCAPSTMTSTKVLFSGRFFLQKGGLPAEVETLAEVMGAAGYRTLGVSGNGHVSDKYGMTRGFDTFEMVYPLARNADPATYINRNAADIHRRSLELLDGASPETPTFLYLHTIHPHTPYAPPHEMVQDMCGDIPSSVDGLSPTLLAIRDDELALPDADQNRLRCLYAASVAYNDARIGELTAELERRYPPDEILFIVTSDHGEELFDHGGVLHGHTLYNELLRVPLIFWWPGRLNPIMVDRSIDTFDLHETLRALVGAAASSDAAEGRSLWPAMAGSDEPLVRRRLRFAAVPTLPGGMFMVRSEGFKLVWAPRTGDGWGMGLGLGRSHDPEYFFDLRDDPGENYNRIGAATIHEAWLRSRLRTWIEHYTDEIEVVETVLDEETREHLEALGYVE